MPLSAKPLSAASHRRAASRDAPSSHPPCVLPAGSRSPRRDPDHAPPQSRPCLPSCAALNTARTCHVVQCAALPPTLAVIGWGGSCGRGIGSSLLVGAARRASMHSHAPRGVVRVGTAAAPVPRATRMPRLRETSQVARSPTALRRHAALNPPRPSRRHTQRVPLGAATARSSAGRRFAPRAVCTAARRSGEQPALQLARLPRGSARL
eukprot:354335-Chlamydomonas_euryale.AAC.4